LSKYKKFKNVKTRQKLKNREKTFRPYNSMVSVDHLVFRLSISLSFPEILNTFFRHKDKNRPQEKTHMYR